MENNEVRASELKEGILKYLGFLRTKYVGKTFESEKLEYITTKIDSLKGKKIIGEDEEDITSTFIQGLRNIITDPGNRLLQYVMSQCPVAEILKPAKGYSSRPLVVKPTFMGVKLIKTSQSVEVGRALIHMEQGLHDAPTCIIEFVELNDTWKNLFLSDVLKDSVQSQFGFGIVLEYDKDFLGVHETEK